MQLKATLSILALTLTLGVSGVANAQAYFEGLEPSRATDVASEVRVETSAGPEGFQADIFDKEGKALGRVLVAPDGKITKELSPDIDVQGITVDRAMVSAEDTGSCGASTAGFERCKYRSKITVTFCIRLIWGWCWCWTKSYYVFF